MKCGEKNKGFFLLVLDDFFVFIINIIVIIFCKEQLEVVSIGF